MSDLAYVARLAATLADWIEASPHEKGSINGLAAQISSTYRYAMDVEARRRVVMHRVVDAWLGDCTGETDQLELDGAILELQAILSAGNGRQ